MTRTLKGAFALTVAVAWNAPVLAQTERPAADPQQGQETSRQETGQQQQTVRGRIAAVGAAARARDTGREAEPGQAGQAGQSGQDRSTFILVEGRPHELGQTQDRPARAQTSPSGAPNQEGATGSQGRGGLPDGQMGHYLLKVTQSTRIENSVAGQGSQPGQAGQAGQSSALGSQAGQDSQLLRGLQVGQHVEVMFRPMAGGSENAAGLPGQADPAVGQAQRSQAGASAEGRIIRGEAISIRVMPNRAGENQPGQGNNPTGRSEQLSSPERRTEPSGNP